MKKVLLIGILMLFSTVVMATGSGMKWVYDVDRIIWTGVDDVGTVDSDSNDFTAMGELVIYDAYYEVNAEVCGEKLAAGCIPLYDKRHLVGSSAGSKPVYTIDKNGHEGEVRILSLDPLIVEWVLNEDYGNTIVTRFNHVGDFPIDE